jgi:glycerophosphoryl diester phosphodiesterase
LAPPSRSTLLSLFGQPDHAFDAAGWDRDLDWLASVTYAHRGWHDTDRIENSQSAFAAAIDAGLGIECDVQGTADDHAVVFHDWDLDRLTEATGNVREHTVAELIGTCLRGSDDRVPALPAVLRQIAGKVPLLIEIKSRRSLPFRELCCAVEQALRNYRGNVAVMSFDPRVVRWFADQAPRVVRGLVVTEENNRGAAGLWQRSLALRHSCAQFLAYDVRDLPSAFAARHRRRLPLLTWTVRTAELRERAEIYADAAIAERDGLPASHA